MNNETLLRAMSDVGDDLLVMAEEKKFVSTWRKWGNLAAVFAVILCAGVLALPHLNFGESKGGDEAKKGTPMAQMQIKKTEPEASDDKMETEMPEQEIASDAKPDAEPEMAPDVTDGLGMGTGETEPVYEALSDRFVCRGTYYYIRPVRVDSGLVKVGEPLGKVTEAVKPELVDCPVYEVPYSTWFTNYAVDGEPVTQAVYIQTPDGYRYAVTANEKIVSRYTAQDAKKAIEEENLQWLSEQFVRPVECYGDPDFASAFELSSEQMNELLWATMSMNTGVGVADCWIDVEGRYVIPIFDVRWRLSRFLDEYFYEPAQTEAYDEELGSLVFEEEPARDEVQIEVLEAEMIDGDALRLLIVRNDGEETTKEYLIRFGKDSWRYERIRVIEE